MSERFGLSIVVPVYNGAASIGLLVEALAGLPVAGGLEIILVNDGSSDGSLAVCTALARYCPVPLTIIDLARNFGEHNAVMAGLAQARGEHVITMDDDLQNPPEEVVRLHEEARRTGHDIIYTHFAQKRHAPWRNLGSGFANWCADRLLDKPAGLYLSSFRCLSAFAVQAILAYRGPHPHVDGLLLQVTNRIGTLRVVHHARAAGRSNYTLRRLARLWVSLVINFSAAPLRIGMVLGLISGIAGLLTALVGGGLPALLLILAAAQFCMLGLIGEYVGRLAVALGGKPQFVVRSQLRSPGQPPSV
ncbi:glycosyltransferase family 2 protein [Niveispirillum sp. KHB5.9]|uniref:glycosyltransferase family 2 protein n=1 Tax=Niveispirillum sp. KHB5.9 TaxID=3400269 RepID=UPI003A8904B6